MALAAGSLGSWNGDKLFVFGGWLVVAYRDLVLDCLALALACVSVAGDVVVLVRHGSGVRGHGSGRPHEHVDWGLLAATHPC